MAKFLTILLAEAAIEPFPKELLNDIKARQYLSKLKKSADEVLLDMSYHSHLVETLPDAEKRFAEELKAKIKLSKNSTETSI